MKEQKQELLETRISIAFYLEGVLNEEQDKVFTDTMVNAHLSDGMKLNDLLSLLKPSGFTAIPTNITADMHTAHTDETETQITRLVTKTIVAEVKLF